MVGSLLSSHQDNKKKQKDIKTDNHTFYKLKVDHVEQNSGLGSSKVPPPTPTVKQTTKTESFWKTEIYCIYPF